MISILRASALSASTTSRPVFVWELSSTSRSLGSARPLGVSSRRVSSSATRRRFSQSYARTTNRSCTSSSSRKSTPFRRSFSTLEREGTSRPFSTPTQWCGTATRATTPQGRTRCSSTCSYWTDCPSRRASAFNASPSWMTIPSVSQLSRLSRTSKIPDYLIIPPKSHWPLRILPHGSD